VSAAVWWAGLGSGAVADGPVELAGGGVAVVEVVVVKGVTTGVAGAAGGVATGVAGAAGGVATGVAGGVGVPSTLALGLAMTEGGVEAVPASATAVVTLPSVPAGLPAAVAVLLGAAA